MPKGAKGQKAPRHVIWTTCCYLPRSAMTRAKTVVAAAPIFAWTLGKSTAPAA